MHHWIAFTDFFLFKRTTCLVIMRKYLVIMTSRSHLQILANHTVDNDGASFSYETLGNTDVY